LIQKFLSHLTSKNYW